MKWNLNMKKPIVRARAKAFLKMVSGQATI